MSQERVSRDRITTTLWVVGTAVFAFIYLPLVVVIVYSVHDSPIIAWPLKLGTLRWYTALTHDRAMLGAALASLKPDGQPFASYVVTAPDVDGSPLMLLSRLAEHTRNLEGDPRASLLFVREPVSSPRRH